MPLTAHRRIALVAPSLLLAAFVMAPGAVEALPTRAPGHEAPAEAARPGPAAPADDQVVVKVDLADGYTIDDLTSDYPIQIDSAILASRGIYLVSQVDETPPGPGGPGPGGPGGPGGGPGGGHGADDLASELSRSSMVVYAEPNYGLTLADEQYHAWPDGPWSAAGRDQALWTDQPAAAALHLDAAHAISTGAGEVVAVLDTGAAPRHPALAGRMLPGWDYVDDDADTADRREGVDSNADGRIDEAVGHGTFVAGVVALVAPQAKILPERVLDSDGTTNIFLATQAIIDATDAGARVINLSFGTVTPIPSQLLDGAIAYAQRHGATVVAAAGNDHSSRPHYPAACDGVIAVGALDSTLESMAAFSAFGPWVDVAAPGTSVVGPVPGGRFAWWSGTSLAAPFVAGQAALILAQDDATSARPGPGPKPTESVADTIMRTAEAMHGPNVPPGQIDVLASLGASGRGGSRP